MVRGSGDQVTEEWEIKSYKINRTSKRTHSKNDTTSNRPSSAGALLALVRRRLRAQNNANQNQAQLRLVIVDQTGAGIPMADVTVTSTTAGGEPVTYKSDEKGLANSPALTPGDVIVHVEFPGFVPFEAPLNLKRGLRTRS